MPEMLLVFLSVQFVVTGVCLWRLLTLEWRQGQDARYFEWWMRSMEERKQDKETDEVWEE